MDRISFDRPLRRDSLFGDLAGGPPVAGRAIALPLGRPRFPIECGARRALAARAVAPFAIAGLSGLAYAAAFPPLSWTPLAWVALAPLLVACAELSPLRAAAAGMCWTAAAATGVAAFVPSMLSSYFGLPTATTWIATVAIVAGLHGVWVSAYAAWVAWMAEQRAVSPVLLAAGWVFCELARTAFGSPWALAAYSQIGWAPLIQIGDLAGPYGIGMLIAAVNACVAACFAPTLRGGRPAFAAATTGTVLVAALLYGQWRLGQTFGEKSPVGVAVVQAGAPSSDPAERSARLERHVELSRRGRAANTGLIVWPEHAVEAYLEEPSRTRDAVLRLASDTGADLVLGGPHYESSRSGTHYHNSAYLVRDGRLAGRYDKHRLVPFAEDDLLAGVRGSTPSGYTGYTPGGGGFVLRGNSLRIGTVLCVEAMFPDLARRAAYEGADVLVELSNDGWFGDDAASLQQLDIARLRAVENRRYLVRAAATGFSAVIDPHGQVIAESDLDAFQVVRASVRASHVRTPYQLWGDALAWIAVASVAAATLRALFDRTTTLHDDKQRRFR